MINHFPSHCFARIKRNHFFNKNNYCCCCYLIKLEKSVLKRIIFIVESQFWLPEKYFNSEMIVLTLVNYVLTIKPFYFDWKIIYLILVTWFWPIITWQTLFCHKIMVLVNFDGKLNFDCKMMILVDFDGKLGFDRKMMFLTLVTRFWSFFTWQTRFWP